MLLEIDSILNDRYRILKQLGRGGFGEVYQAWDLRLDGPCAVKRNLQLAPEVRRQFESEARMLFKLRHPGLPKVYDYFEGQGDEQYLVMELVEGEDLRSRLGSSKLAPVKQVLEWIEQVCEALIYLHSRQPPVFHRDIKPANIIITPEGQAILVDFGIAKADPQLRTISGARAWTPGYAPPEQYGQGGTDAQSDVYSLAATAYALLAGQSPPDAMDIVAGEKLPPRPIHELNPAVSLPVSRAIEQAMRLSRAERTRSAAEFLQALKAQPVSQSPEDKDRVESTLRLPVESGGKPVLPATQSDIQSPPGKLHKNRLWIGYVAGAVALVIVIGLGFGVSWLQRNGRESPAQTAVVANGKAAGTQTAQAEYTQAAASLIERLETETAFNQLQRTATADAIRYATQTSLTVATDTPTIDLNQPGACSQIGQTWTSPMDGMTLVCVPAGKFTMGSESGSDDEKPVHSVYLDAFWIDQTEVTNAMFVLFVKEQGYRTVLEERGRSKVWTGDKFEEVTGANWQRPEGPGSNIEGRMDYPVVHITRQDALAYCRWAGRRLPTEAEWEKAARGTDERLYPWGDDLDCGRAQYQSCDGKAIPVGSLPQGASPYDALDMAGNVWEWVSDGYREGYYAISPERNPPGPVIDKNGVRRGGSWFSGAGTLRSANRGEDVIVGTDGYLNGFRCAQSAP